MLTPKRSGPITPEKIGDGSEKSRGNEETVIPGTMDILDHNAKSELLKFTDQFEDIPYNIGNGSVTANERDYQLGTFLSSQSSRRRNAIPNMFGCQEKRGSLDLPGRFEDLSVNIDESNNGEPDPNAPSTSKQPG